MSDYALLASLEFSEHSRVQATHIPIDWSVHSAMSTRYHRERLTRHKNGCVLRVTSPRKTVTVMNSRAELL